MRSKVNYGGMISFMVTAFIFLSSISSFATTTTYTYDDWNRKVTVEQGTPGAALTYSISGTVTSGGSALAGVTISLSGTASGTTTTDSNGFYGFINLSNGNYTVTPSKTNYTFTPPNRAVTISGANVTAQDFTGITASTTYSISGTVTTPGSLRQPGSPIAGVTMTLSGASTGTTTADVNGNYSFPGLANGNYTVTPSMTGYAFTPTSRSVTISGANVTGQDFTGTTASTTYSISGTVTTPGSLQLPGSPIAGVTMTLSGASSGTTTTDSSGNYSFTGLANGNYTVTPSLAGYTFTPASRAVTISGANVTGQDFSGTPSATSFSISGAMTITGTTTPIVGATVDLSGDASGSTTTDSLGNYSFTGLANGSYTVVPSIRGYTFTPASRSVTISGTNVTGQDFTRN